MKRKLIILTLCFTIIFSSINFNKSYADGGVISLPILATVSSLAVGTGIIINGSDDLYDIGRIFYDYIDRHNDLTWQTVQSVFASSVSLQANKLVSVKSEFLDIVKGFFDNTFYYDSNISYVGGLPSSRYNALDLSLFSVGSTINIPLGYSSKGVYSLSIYVSDVGEYSINLLCDGTSVVTKKLSINIYSHLIYGTFNSTTGYFNLSRAYSRDQATYERIISDFFVGRDFVGSISFPYKGGYTWDNVDSKKENGSISLPIPGNLGNLVGQNSTDFWDNVDNLVGVGDISIPSVKNPSISLDGTVSFPNTNVDTNNPSVPDIDAPNIDGILPAFPSFGDSLDFSPMHLTNVTEKFPFSLPWDIGRLIQKFDVEPVAPVFEVPIISETITLDLTEFSELASIIRFFVLIGFILSLIFISTKLMA